MITYQTSSTNTATRTGPIPVKLFISSLSEYRRFRVSSLLELIANLEQFSMMPFEQTKLYYQDDHQDWIRLTDLVPSEWDEMVACAGKSGLRMELEVPQSSTQVEKPIQLQMQADELPQSTMKLAACKCCGRKFNVDRLSKHEKICTRASRYQRSVFPSKRQRTTWEMEKAATILRRRTKVAFKSTWRSKHSAFQKLVKAKKMMYSKTLPKVHRVRRSPSKGNSHTKRFNAIKLAAHKRAKRAQRQRPIFNSRKQRLSGLLQQEEKKSNWRATRQAFKASIRAAKKKFARKACQVVQEQPTGLTARKPCNTCGRFFNKKALVRHAPICSNMKKRPVFNAKEKRVPTAAMNVAPSKENLKRVHVWTDQRKQFREAIQARKKQFKRNSKKHWNVTLFTGRAI